MKLTPYLVCLLVMAAAALGAEIDEKIYNGKDAKLGQFPYQALLISTQLLLLESVCGGSLISTKYVLTAAHCTSGVIYTRVYLGLIEGSSRSNAPSNFVPFYRIRNHPQYNPRTFDNDVAILTLPSDVTLTENIGTIKLPKQAWAAPSTFDNSSVTASGWGKTNDGNEGLLQTLQYAVVNKMPQSECVTYFANVNTVTDGMICTDKKVIYAGPCQGDSGGPLTVTNDGEKYVIGAVSWGVGDCSNQNPVVYANVAHYLQWINSVTGIQTS